MHHLNRLPTRNIAKYSELANATTLADSGAAIRMLKRHADWKSDAVARRYVVNC